MTLRLAEGASRPSRRAQCSKIVRAREFLSRRHSCVPGSARWLTAMVVLIAAMALITYFYSLQVDTGESDETTTAASLSTIPMLPA